MGEVKSPNTFITKTRMDESNCSSDHGIEDIESEEEQEPDPFLLNDEGPEVYASDMLDEGYIDVARIEEGGSIGELALIDGKPRMCTVKSLTRCHLLTLNRFDFAKA